MRKYTGGPALNVTKDDLEFAAKSVGLIIRTDRFGAWRCEDDGSPICQWRPCDDGGDAFRLAAALKMSIVYHEDYQDRGSGVTANDCFEWIESEQLVGDTPAAATRLAIFRAAVEIGKAMK